VPGRRTNVIPKTLNEWTLKSLNHLLDDRYLEPESFDYKSMLPHPNDHDGKRRLRDACAAFANSVGGFLIFGVADDARLPTNQRLVGLAATLDFPVQFGSFPSQSNPTVRWEFLNPPLRLESGNGNLVHVVWFPKSWTAPHSVGRSEEGLLFPKRTNKGTEYMSYEEVRMNFLGFYEKRLHLQLLDAELLALHDSTKGAYVVDGDQIESSYSLITFETRIIDTVIADTYTLTAGHSELLSTLQQLRQAVIVANNKAHIFYSTATLSFDNKGKMIRAHNEFMAEACGRISELAKRARTLLQPLLVA
jgi:hypothetical protein